MGIEDWAYAWGVEDASFGMPAGSPSSPITPDTRERYMAGYNSHEARRAANRNMIDLEKARQAKSQAEWKRIVAGEPPAKPKQSRKHPHGSDW